MMVWFGLVWFGLVWFGSVPLDTTARSHPTEGVLSAAVTLHLTDGPRWLDPCPYR